VEELGELFGIELKDEDVETVGGLLAKALGRVPIPGSGAEVPVEDGEHGPVALRLTAESAAGRRNRIGTVLVEPVPAEETEQDADAEEAQ
jgi:CBS domain containing-hemolysin-like protein